MEEAIAKALEQLGLSRDEVEVDVLQRGKSGFLGIGAEEARVRVTPLHPRDVEAPDVEADPVQVAKEVLERLLSLMGVVASVEATVSPAEEANSTASLIVLNVKGEDLGILIGRRGQSLASLQHIVRLLVVHRLKRLLPLSVDVEGYAQRHNYSLRSLALGLARKVSSSGRAITLEPMPANERRVIHLALADHPDVTTQSVGCEEGRKVMILPKTRQPFTKQSEIAP